jgi:two-component system sporulation sensor kinase A
MQRNRLEADALFLHAFTYAAIGMAVVSLQGAFLKVNGSLCRLTGYTETDLLTKTYADITHSDDVELDMQRAKELVEGKIETYQMEKRYIHKDGYHIWVLLSVTLVRDNTGEPLFFMAQMQNITDRKKTESVHKEHLEQYKSLFDHNPDLVYSISLDGVLLSINDSAERMTGYTGQELFRVTPSLLDAHIRHALKHANEGSAATYHFETSIPHKQGHLVHVNVTHVPIVVDGDIIGIYGIAKSLAGQLAAGIAHEIRNPITALNGFLKLMLGGNNKRQYLEVMSEELQRIDSILNELLLLAKPKQAPVTVRNLTEIAHGVVALLESQANLNNIRLQVRHPAEPVVIRCDENQLKQAFINFVKNAMKAMPLGGETSIEITSNDNKAEVRFIDQGCGIPEDKLSSIGQPFFTTKDGGTGLGLIVSFNIIEMHQGTVSVHSRLGSGTTFVVTLPLSP